MTRRKKRSPTTRVVPQDYLDLATDLCEAKGIELLHQSVPSATLMNSDIEMIVEALRFYAEHLGAQK